MGVQIDWTIRAKHKNDYELTQPERDSLYQAVADYCEEEFDSEGIYLASFYTTNGFAADDVDVALRDFSAAHPDIIVTTTCRAEQDECPDMYEYEAGAPRWYRGEVHYVFVETTPADKTPS